MPHPDTVPEPGCVFCAIVHDESPATVLAEGARAVIIAPLEPAAPGHALVIPRVHVADATVDPEVTAMVVKHAVTFLGKRQGNILTSVGPMATQTVMHLNVHVIPRGARDGLHEDWPWLRDIFNRIRPYG